MVTSRTGTALRRAVPSLLLWAAGWCGNAGAWVALDVGHTLDKPGASSARGRVEFEFNRTLAMDIARALRVAATAVAVACGVTQCLAPGK